MNAPFVDQLQEHISHLHDQLPEDLKYWCIRVSGEDHEQQPWTKGMPFKLIFYRGSFKGFFLVQVSSTGEMIPTRPWDVSLHASLRAWRDDMYRSFQLGPKSS